MVKQQQPVQIKYQRTVIYSDDARIACNDKDNIPTYVIYRQNYTYYKTCWIYEVKI